MKPKRFFFHQTRIFGQTLRCGVPLAIGFMVLVTGLDADAGDILRGGGAQRGKGGARKASNIDTPTPDATDAARANARDMLARTDRTLAAMRAMQKAARNAANKGPDSLGKNPLKPTVNLPKVPNGLVTGGLKVSGSVTTDPTKWTGAKLPTQTVKNGKSKVTIKQTEQQALLEWETFNLGKKTTLTFDQSKGGEDVGKWIAFNKVSDPSANPTQILGNIKADGQVYIINPNGIIFGGSSQVNARGLTVSSLPINDNLIDLGLLNNRDAQFLFSGLDIPAGVYGTPAFTPESPADPSGRYGDVTVQKGATLKSPTNAAKVGGRIALVGPNVINNGSILTPDGQTILAAGLQVGFVAHSASDPSLRGLDTIVGQIDATGVAPYAGTVTQNGIIDSARGNITLTGKSIFQNGALESTTSVSLNGRIDINASYNAIRNPDSTALGTVPFLYQNAGLIDHGENSQIRILPEYDSAEKVVGTELALNSAFNSTAGTIHMGTGSTLLVPSGDARFNAGEWRLTGAASAPKAEFSRTAGRIHLDTGAVIDVSGTLEVPIPVSQNIIEVELRGAELADSPLQREGVLRNQTIYVDIRDAGNYKQRQWIGTPLANVEGFANLIERGVGQLTTAGGTVELNAGGSVVMLEGSIINVSGGSTFFTGEMVRTSRLWSGGRLMDISESSPDVVYQGLFDGSFTVSNEKFQVSETFFSMLAPAGYRYEASASQGAAGGSLRIAAPSMALQGKLLGKTFPGTKQTQSPPAGSSLTVSLTSQDPAYGNLPITSPSPPSVVFRRRTAQLEAPGFSLDADGNPEALPSELIEELQLESSLLSKAGFSSLELENPDGDVIIPENVEVRANTGGGSLTLSGANIRIDGSIIMPSGIVSFRTSVISLATLNKLNNSTGNVLPVPSGDRGLFALGSGGIIDVSGIVRDEQTGRNSEFPYDDLTGGSVSVKSFSSVLANGGRIDVSGGASVLPNKQISYGDAGSVLISAGSDPNQSAVIGGLLTLDCKLAGFSGNIGGRLSITAPAIRIGGETTPGALSLGQDFFNQGGFSSFELASSGLSSETPGIFSPGIVVASGTTIHPLVASLEADTRDDKLVLRRILNPEGQRPAGSISFSAAGKIDPYQGGILGYGEVRVEEGATIKTDGKGSLSFTASAVTILGNLRSPGGKITIAGDSRFPAINPDTLLPTVLIGSGAHISAAGKSIYHPNPLGFRQGSILAGGTISISGNIAAERGAVIDVSGTSGILDLPPTSCSLDPSVIHSYRGKERVPVGVDSNGGRISLSGSQFLFSDATLTGAAGGASATGGSVSVSSGRFIPLNTAFTSADASLVVRQTGSLVPDGFAAKGPGFSLTDSAGNLLPGIGTFNVSTMKDGGLDSLSLGGNVRFESDVAISLPGSLRLASGGVIYADGNVDIRAGAVVIGQNFAPPSLPSENPVLFTQRDASGNETPYTFAPVSGDGALAIRANHIDVGNLSLQGIGRTRLDAASGDLRGNGTLGVAGDLLIKAGQTHPTTSGAFNIFTYDPSPGSEGSVVILGSAKTDIPLAADGTLGIYASNIDIRGTLRSPVGTINLGWDGTGDTPLDPISGNTIATPRTGNLTLDEKSVVSVSALNRNGAPVIIPFGISLDGSSWISPVGLDITLAGAPAKNINLKADVLETRKGSEIDIRGGGDLYAYRWISGSGGTSDILESDSSFAIIPEYDALAAPFAPYNTSSSAGALGGADGYVNPNLKIGDQIELSSGKGFSGGVFTLLPARYALLPGAWLISPVGGPPANTVKSPDSSLVLAGYTFNALDSSRSGPTTITRFELASGRLVRERAEYVDLLASSFLTSAASVRGLTPQVLPLDAGRVSFGAQAAARIRGTLASAPAENGRGALVDISSSGSILINGSGQGGSEGALVLSSKLLGSFKAESVLVGGSRELEGDQAQVEVTAERVIVDTKGKKLRGEDLILTARDSVSVSNGSIIESRKSDATPTRLSFGSEDAPGSGNSAVLRVSGIAGQSIERFSINNSASPLLRISSGARIKAAQSILDSPGLTDLSASAVINSNSVTLGSSRISIRLNNPGNLAANPGLTLGGKPLEKLLESSSTFDLRAYSGIDVYGTGTFGGDKTSSITLTTPVLRGRNNGGGTATFRSGEIVLTAPQETFATGTSPATGNGSLRMAADSILLGSGNISLEGVETVRLSAEEAIRFVAAGSLASSEDMALESGLITGASAATYNIDSAGALRLANPGNISADSAVSGLGSSLALSGKSVSINSNIILTSGRLSATAQSGDIKIGDSSSAIIRVDGGLVRLGALSHYTDAGFIDLQSINGDIRIFQDAVLSASGRPGGGSAGTISIKAAKGLFVNQGDMLGTASKGERSGIFRLDVSQISGTSLEPLDVALNSGGFAAWRDYRIRSGDIRITGSVTAAAYRVTVDQGDLSVSGSIDASGKTGGIIDLKASGSLVLTTGAVLDASAMAFDTAGKGGAITLEAGNPIGASVSPSATLDLQSGSLIDLTVDASGPNSQSHGRFSGTLHLRAPRVANNSDIAIETIGSDVRGASSILVEGTKVYEITGTTGTISSTLQTTIRNEAQSYLGTAGTASSAYDAMHSRLTSLQSGLDLILAPGVEIGNSNGDITLGTVSSTASSDWNLSSWRFGPRSAAGVLTLRASEDLVFLNSLSDGFSGGASLWLAPLSSHNPLLPSNIQSWSFRLAAGADLSSASFRSTMEPAALAAGTGMLDLGKNAGSATVGTGGANARTSTLITKLYQVIRTGSGNIDIHTAGGVRLLNQFASIYTAGTRLADEKSILSAGDFSVPILDRNVQQGNLGTAQQNYLAQYSMAGGNVTIESSGDLERKTLNNSGLIDDSSRQLPNNWLYRRSYLAPDGTYGAIRIGTGFTAKTDPAATTSWWVDFSNFFQGVGALGGGNVSLNAGGSIRNFDASIPTNARSAAGKPSAAGFAELGGGSLSVTARRDISGGVYYVERGNGTLTAGGAITTNATRSPSFGLVGNLNDPAAATLDSRTWLPTTLFVGKSSFSATSSGDLLLGPVSNPFLLPQGIGNRFWYKTYFSTMSPDASVEAVSLGGSTEYRNAITLLASNQAIPALLAWHQTQLLLTNSPSSTAWFQPWLRLAETDVTQFSPIWSLSAPSISLESLSSDVNLAGNLTTFPSPAGQIDILAAGAVNALRPTGLSDQIILGSPTQIWTSSIVNLSDSDPASIPGIFTPLSTSTEGPNGGVVTSNTTTGFMLPLSNQLVESGSFTGSDGTLQRRQARHTEGGLYRDASDPVRIQAFGGDISGLTLFTGKSALITAGRDITDVSLYLQGNRETDLSVVAAGRDITLFNSNSTLRAAASAFGNSPGSGQSPLAGDIQIAGPGNLQVLAGGNLDLGVGSNNADGTATGITSIGNLRNPYLPAAGANLTVAAGIGPAGSLGESALDFNSFITQFATSPEGDRYLAEAKGILGVVIDYSGSKRLKKGVMIKSVSAGGSAEAAGLKAGDVILKVAEREISKNYDDSYLLSGIKIGEATKIRILRGDGPRELTITPGSDLLDLTDPAYTRTQKEQIALSLFYLVLRDTGRDYNDPDSPGYRKYDSGEDAIESLFPSSTDWNGQILTQNRDIRTKSGGSIAMISPGGGISMAAASSGNTLAPPGIITESGGNVSVFADDSVSIGIGRIFTLRGGDITIWSSKGNIAAGSSSRTVQSAPPTRVIVDPQSASVETDLAGLATGGGIGVLATVKGVPPGDVDLIAPTGEIDAGDAGIRVTGNINLAAVTVVNSANISAGGASSGTATAVSAPSISTVTTASNTAAASAAATSPVNTKPEEKVTSTGEETLSVFTVTVIGYGGGGASDQEEEEEKNAGGDSEPVN